LGRRFEEAGRSSAAAMAALIWIVDRLERIPGPRHQRPRAANPQLALVAGAPNLRPKIGKSLEA